MYHRQICQLAVHKAHYTLEKMEMSKMQNMRAKAKLKNMFVSSSMQLGALNLSEQAIAKEYDARLQELESKWKEEDRRALVYHGWATETDMEARSYEYTYQQIQDYLNHAQYGTREQVMRNRSKLGIE